MVAKVQDEIVTISRDLLSEREETSVSFYSLFSSFLSLYLVAICYYLLNPTRVWANPKTNHDHLKFVATYVGNSNVETPMKGSENSNNGKGERERERERCHFFCFPFFLPSYLWWLRNYSTNKFNEWQRSFHQHLELRWRCDVTHHRNRSHNMK
jgi:hypothetical protein